MQAGKTGLYQKLGDPSTLQTMLQNARVALRSEAAGLLPIVVLEYIFGWDLSGWDKTIDWKMVGETAPELKYVNIKTTEGDGYTNPFWKQQWDGSGSIGQLRGGYHYHHTEMSGKDQAKYYLSVTPKGEIFDTLDVEDSVHLSQYPTIAQAKAAGQSVYEWTDTVAQARGQKVIIYTGGWFWNRLAIYAQAASKSCDYFGATYHALDDVGPYMSIGWNTWTLWQYSSKGKVTGIPDYVDMSVFHGGADVFKAWHGGTVVVPPPIIVPPPPVVVPPPPVIVPPPTPGYPFNAHVHNPVFGMYVRSQARADSFKVKWIPDGFKLVIFSESKDAWGQSWGRMQFGYVSMKWVAPDLD